MHRQAGTRAHTHEQALTTPHAPAFHCRSRNALTGTLPASWGGSLRPAAFLDLSHNRLSGTVPASWGALGASPLGQPFNQLNLTHNAGLRGCLPGGLLARVKASGGCEGTRLTCSACTLI